MLFGVDVSHYQGVVDWPRVGQACQFAIIKATQGASSVDPMFQQNRAGAVAHVQVPGAYHFAVPGDPIQQAQHFYATAGDLPILALDLEEENTQMGRTWKSRGQDPQQFATMFLSELEHLAGRAWIYTGPGFIAEYGINLTAYPLWLAQYGPVAHPSPWPVTSIWQYADNGTVPGVARPCDVNRSDLTVQQLIGQEAPEVLDPNDPTVKQIQAQQNALATTLVKLTAAVATLQGLDTSIKKELDAEVASWGPHIDKLP